MAFRIGDEEITRDMMPAQIAWQQANPEYHLAQSVQDIFAKLYGGGMMMPQQQDMGLPQTAETSNQWNGGNR